MSVSTLHRLLELPAEAGAETVKLAYQAAAKRLHPDSSVDGSTAAFIELQAAWKKYTTAEPRRKGFTDFGVGCSFADTDEEKLDREAIVMQASCGVMPSGLLEHEKRRERPDD